MPHTSSPTPDAAHLLIAFATAGDEAALQALQSLPKAEGLENLSRLLQGMQTLAPSDDAQGSALSLSAPHEKALAGLQAASPNQIDGLIPLAAQQAWAAMGSQTLGKGWGFITPCYWSMGREHASMTNPATLGLEEAQSKEFMAAMQPYFVTEGISLHYAAPDCWLAEGELLKDLPTASLDRVMGRNVDTWLPGNEDQPRAPLAAKKIKLLQNEMQMLLYTHAVNDARSQQRQTPVNSFWLSGTGMLAQAPTPQASGLIQPRTLAEAVFASDWAAYAKAWQALDKTEIKDLLARQNTGEKIRITLCGERNFVTLESRSRTLGLKFASLLKPSSALALLRDL